MPISKYLNLEVKTDTVDAKKLRRVLHKHLRFKDNFRWEHNTVIDTRYTIRFRKMRTSPRALLYSIYSLPGKIRYFSFVMRDTLWSMPFDYRERAVYIDMSEKLCRGYGIKNTVQRLNVKYKYEYLRD